MANDAVVVTTTNLLTTIIHNHKDVKGRGHSINFILLFIFSVFSVFCFFFLAYLAI